MKSIRSADYQRLLADIKQRVRSAQYEALKAVNKELISLYWDIGRMIVKRQTGDTWGKSVWYPNWYLKMVLTIVTTNDKLKS